MPAQAPAVRCRPARAAGNSTCAFCESRPPRRQAPADTAARRGFFARPYKNPERPCRSGFSPPPIGREITPPGAERLRPRLLRGPPSAPASGEPAVLPGPRPASCKKAEKVSPFSAFSAPHIPRPARRRAAPVSPRRNGRSAALQDNCPRKTRSGCCSAALRPDKSCTGKP